MTKELECGKCGLNHLTRGCKELTPASLYQCISKPGSCKFEWTCGPLCACVLSRRGGGTGTEQEKRDVKNAQNRQYRWRKKLGLA